MSDHSGQSDGLHSRACGLHSHTHGSQCSVNCPTCGGRDISDSQQTAPAPVDTLGDMAEVFREWKKVGMALGSIQYALNRVYEAEIEHDASLYKSLMGDFPCCADGDCSGPGSYCCKRTGPHSHPEEGLK